MGRHDSSRTKKFGCPLCPKSFYNGASRRVHISAVHTKEKLNNCCECSYGTIYPSKLKIHRAQAHKNEEEARVKMKLLCKSCDFRGNNIHKLERHMAKVHPTERLYACEHGGNGCQFTTNYYQTLQGHMRTHGVTLPRKSAAYISRLHTTRPSKNVDGQWAKPHSIPVVVVQKINLQIL